MSSSVAAVREYPNMYKKDFDAVVAYLSQYIDKKAPTPCVKAASVEQKRPPRRKRPVLPVACQTKS